MMIPKEALTRIDEVKKSGTKLNNWEKGFIATVKIQAEQGRYLRIAQADKLKTIHQRLIGKNGR